MDDPVFEKSWGQIHEKWKIHIFAWMYICVIF